MTLHLPGPHLCPVCNVVHGRDPLPDAWQRRPYEATYLYGKIPPATPLVSTITMSGAGSGITPANGGMNIPGTVWDGAWTITCGKAGYYQATLMVYERSDGTGSSIDLSIRHNGVDQAMLTYDSWDNGIRINGAPKGARYRNLLAAGDTLSVGYGTFDSVDANAGTSYFEVLFIPVAAYANPNYY